MGKLANLIQLLRIRQWYKNLAVFLPIVFSGNLLNLFFLQKTLLGFVSLCFASSAGYILNDYLDLERDRKHPEKSKRPLASGKIKLIHSLIFSFALLVLSAYFALLLSKIFFYFVLALFLLTLVYSVWLRKEAFADVILISVNFVIRAVSGAFVITAANKPYIWVSPWLILCPFFLALFLSLSKRAADLKLLGKKAALHKESLSVYTLNITRPLMIISTTLLLISYALYTFLSVHQQLLLTLPFAVYTVFRYFYLVESGSEIARKPEKVFTDIRIMAAFVLWALTVFGVVYLLG